MLHSVGCVSWAGERVLWIAVYDWVFCRPGKKGVCHLYLLLDLPQETREKAVGARMGRITPAGKWKASRRAPGVGTTLPGLHVLT